jgi:hypothetical protein
MTTKGEASIIARYAGVSRGVTFRIDVEAGCECIASSSVSLQIGSRISSGICFDYPPSSAVQRAVLV